MLLFAFVPLCFAYISLLIGRLSTGMKLRDIERSSGSEKSGRNMFGRISANSDKYYAGAHPKPACMSGVAGMKLL